MSKKYSKKYNRYKKYYNDKNNEISKTNKLLTYITIILAISQIFSIIYEITSKLYTSVDKIVRQFIMYVLLELPLALISIYLTAISICCIIKIMYLKFDYNREQITEKARIKVEEKQKRKKLKKHKIKTKEEEMIIKFKKETIGRFILTIRLNIVEILTILILPITSYMTIAAVVFQFNFKEMQYSMYFIILIFCFINLMVILFGISNTKRNERIFFNENSFIRAINYVHKVITYKDIIVLRISYLIPILLNIILVFEINRIDNFFINLENKMYIDNEIRYDKEIKYDIIVDKLFNKVGIYVTDEDIEEYKKEIKEKYKLED